MKRFLLSLAAALSLSAATPALASTAPRAARVHVVEGGSASLLATYAPWVIVRVSHPVIDGTLDQGAGSFEVAPDRALRALARATGWIDDQALGHVRLERKDGERLWHVVAFTRDAR